MDKGASAGRLIAACQDRATVYIVANKPTPRPKNRTTSAHGRFR